MWSFPRSSFSPSAFVNPDAHFGDFEFDHQTLNTYLLILPLPRLQGENPSRINCSHIFVNSQALLTLSNYYCCAFTKWHLKPITGYKSFPCSDQCGHKYNWTKHFFLEGSLEQGETNGSPCSDLQLQLPISTDQYHLENYSREGLKNSSRAAKFKHSDKKICIKKKGIGEVNKGMQWSPTFYKDKDRSQRGWSWRWIYCLSFWFKKKHLFFKWKCNHVKCS